MDFKGFDPRVLDKVNSWHLPQRIVRELSRRVVLLANQKPSDLPSNDKGIYYPANIEDPDNPGHEYWLRLQIKRSDMEFWVADAEGFAIDGDANVIWDSEA